MAGPTPTSGLLVTWMPLNRASRTNFSIPRPWGWLGRDWHRAKRRRGWDKTGELARPESAGEPVENYPAGALKRGSCTCVQQLAERLKSAWANVPSGIIWYLARRNGYRTVLHCVVNTSTYNGRKMVISFVFYWHTIGVNGLSGHPVLCHGILK